MAGILRKGLADNLLFLISIGIPQIAVASKAGRKKDKAGAGGVVAGNLFTCRTDS